MKREREGGEEERRKEEREGDGKERRKERKKILQSFI